MVKHSPDTLAGLFRARCRASAERPAMRWKGSGGWEELNWRGYGERVRDVALGLHTLGLRRGERVAILSETRPEWHFVDVAALCCGAASVGIYHTNTPPQVAYILDNSQARFLACENESQLAKAQTALASRSRRPGLILFEGRGGEGVLSLDEVAARGREAARREPALFDQLVDAGSAGEVATIIYTSGTTGPPKGAMLTHGNLLRVMESGNQIIGACEQDLMLHFLPLAHAGGRVGGHYLHIFAGYTVAFAEINRLRDYLQEVRATFFYTVPRLWEKFHAAIHERAADASPLRRALLGWAFGVAHAWAQADLSRRHPGLWLRLQHALAERLVFRTLRERLGFGAARAFMSGAAPLAAEIISFFLGIGIRIQEVYGMTETSGIVSINPRHRLKVGSVGVPIPGTEVRIAPDGEICVRGPHVLAGYLGNQAATAETLADGWLHTGDVGTLDEEGYLTITDRKKDILITAGGKNISPQNIENALKRYPLISQAVVIGDRRPYLTALLTLEPEAAAAEAARLGVPPETPFASDPRFRNRIQEIIDEVNRELARVETIKKFTILSRDFSLEADEITPTLKVRRKVVVERYRDVIEAMYR